MKNDYRPSEKRGGLSRMLNLLGILFAFILLIGLLDRAGVKIIISQDQAYQGASILPGMDGSTEDNAENHIVVSAEPTPQQYPDYKSTKAVRPYAASTSKQRKVEAEEWIARFASSARDQALEKGVPAGVALAVGVEKLKQGAQINDWHRFIEAVIIPLVAIKQTASKADIQQFYKYSANSQRWIDGLAAEQRYSASKLNAHMQQYHLHAQDEAVLKILKGGGRYEQQARKKSGRVADEVSTDIVSRRIEEQENAVYSRAAEHDNSADWEQHYDEVVGRAVAKEIARKKLKSGEYISEEDMEMLIEETNTETSDVLKSNISFLGRKINPDHPDAEDMNDITNPRNSQAREEIYQKELRKHKVAGKN